jgi:hypothetical protein
MPGGMLDTLTNAVVVADTSNKSHRIHSATIVIDSKRGYHGSGQYDYVNGKNKQEIAFDNITVKQEGEKKKTTYSTVASTTIDEEDTFHLNNGIRYKGMANLQADKQFLSFDGFAKLGIKDERLDTSESVWFNVKDEVDPNNVNLHYSKLISDKGDTLFAGIGYAMLDSVSFYPSLMRKMKNPDDKKTFEATGVVHYDDATKTYTFGDEDKIKTSGKYGNTMTYDTEKKEIVAEGVLNLGVDYNPIKLLTTGNIVHTIDSNKFVFNALVALKLPIDKTLMEQFGKDVTAFSFDRPNADYTSPQFLASLANTMDNAKAANKALEEMQKTGQFMKPKSLGDYNLIISNVALLYDANYQIFRSIGPVTFSYINEAGIHKQLQGFVEFGMRKDNDFFNIYIESTFDDWYFISYNNHTMQIGSSKEDFNKLLAAIPADKRKIKLSDDQFFFYTIGTFQNMQSFLQRMNLIASGVKVEFDMPTEDDQLEDELNQLKKELMEEENKDNPDGAIEETPGDEPAPSNTGDVAPDSGPKEPKPMLKEIENYDSGGGKKKKGKNKKDETEYIYDMNEPAPEEQEKPEVMPVQKEEAVPPPVEEKNEEPVTPPVEKKKGEVKPDDAPVDTQTVPKPVEEPKKKKGKNKNTEDPSQPKAQEPVKQEGADHDEAAPPQEQVVQPPVEEPKPKVVPVSEEPKQEEPKAEEPKTEEIKPEQKPEEVNPEEVKQEEPKTEEIKPEEPKKEEPKVEETKQEEPKKEEPKAEETKQETKPEEVKTEEVKPEETKPEEVKPEGNTETAPTTQPEETKGKKKKDKNKKDEGTVAPVNP